MAVCRWKNFDQAPYFNIYFTRNMFTFPKWDLADGAAGQGCQVPTDSGGEPHSSPRQAGGLSQHHWCEDSDDNDDGDRYYKRVKSLPATFKYQSSTASALVAAWLHLLPMWTQVPQQFLLNEVVLLLRPCRLIWFQPSWGSDLWWETCSTCWHSWLMAPASFLIIFFLWPQGLVFVPPLGISTCERRSAELRVGEAFQLRSFNSQRCQLDWNWYNGTSSTPMQMHQIGNYHPAAAGGFRAKKYPTAFIARQVVWICPRNGEFGPWAHQTVTGAWLTIGEHCREELDRSERRRQQSQLRIETTSWYRCRCGCFCFLFSSAFVPGTSGNHYLWQMGRRRKLCYREVLT